MASTTEESASTPATTATTVFYKDSWVPWTEGEPQSDWLGLANWDLPIGACRSDGRSRTDPILLNLHNISCKVTALSKVDILCLQMQVGVRANYSVLFPLV